MLSDLAALGGQEVEGGRRAPDASVAGRINVYRPFPDWKSAPPTSTNVNSMPPVYLTTML